MKQESAAAASSSRKRNRDAVKDSDAQVKREGGEGRVKVKTEGAGGSAKVKTEAKGKRSRTKVEVKHETAVQGNATSKAPFSKEEGASRLRPALLEALNEAGQTHTALTERAMFGGVVFMVNGHMTASAKPGELSVRGVKELEGRKAGCCCLNALPSSDQHMPGLSRWVGKAVAVALARSPKKMKTKGK